MFNYKLLVWRCRLNTDVVGVREIAFLCCNKHLKRADFVFVFMDLSVCHIY